jgi:hypothetical protein
MTFAGFSCVRNANIVSYKAAKVVEDASRAGFLTRIILQVLAHATLYNRDATCTILTTRNKFIAV